MPCRIRGITFSLNLWSRRSDNITALKEIVALIREWREALNHA
jgi:hypothetical protein